MSNYVSDLTSRLHKVGLPQARIAPITAQQPHALSMGNIETFSVTMGGSQVWHVAPTLQPTGSRTV